MKNPLYLAFLIAIGGAAVSFYYGEILLIEPCRLCWYQRMALFPLALILGIATYKQDQTVVAYAMPLALFGLLAALVQAIGIHFPALQVCSKECAKPIFSLFGFITFPDLSALGFAIMILLVFRSGGRRGSSR